MFQFLGLFYEECKQCQHGFSIWKQSVADSYLEKATGESADQSLEQEIDSSIQSIFLCIQKIMGRLDEKLSVMNGEGKGHYILAYAMDIYFLLSDASDIQGVKSLHSFTAQILEDLRLNLVSYTIVCAFTTTRVMCRYCLIDPGQYEQHFVKSSFK